MAVKKILISNDDGIDSEGLIKLAKAAKEFGEVWVVAPDGQRSAMSHKITYSGGIHVRKIDYFPVEGVHAYSCSGTPADCVRIGIIKIVPCKPDVVLSGINDGYNIAGDIQYSGTAAAAFEAAFQKVPAIAFSTDNPEHYEVTDKYLPEVIKKCMDKPLGKNQIWNVNFPSCPVSECKGIFEGTTVSQDDFYDDDYSVDFVDDAQQLQVMTVAPKRNWEATEGTDLSAVIQKYISMGIVNNVR